ncbi:NAD(P)/FAD-dependent oxidoreductase [Rossellomorea marisflavi]|uniref:NADH dehydrogenase n=1 Tax=Rossellomorea marisflavi TaxID=189381 RepID=A0A0M0G391_9BACI|nr:NAD(P)/FAD-dependent oxidoreductase [Rossellomorea marisflavi]KQU57937.1 NADH dehydrogenase [Bacillus sp. Leaf406]MBV6684421.1 NAD(P)/FAD-dependent oxidoreductase [Bacillus sp. JRC01]VXC04356.1 putative NAD-disulfide oxidoreductase [Bacillus sp. 349Y]KON83931.1 NADH dehydrogenase [Rossellomorea marisflavi]MCM2591360.1 NAD(P)/FAD-dependent oxidoreductase [Rossellomorea marisflavi]
MRKPRVVVLGAGYAGLMTVTRLQKQLGTNDAEIILVNKNDYHYETTWLHEASAGTLHHDRVRYDIKGVVNTSKVNFLQASVEDIKVAEKKVVTDQGDVEYDYLVIGLGAEAETFGIQGLHEHAFTISNVNGARQIRDHIDLQFATYKAEGEINDERLTIVVGGAGFTGIEFLGELGNRVPELCKEYDIDQKKVRIVCVEAAPMILPGFDPELVKYARAALEKKGVEFSIGTPLKEAREGSVLIAKSEDEIEELKAGTIVWAAGVRGSTLIEKSGIENMRARVKVNLDLRAPGHDDIFVLGDCSLMINEETERPYPPTAQIAMQQGETCARNIAALVHGKDQLENFKPDIKGTVCSLGEDDAIGVVYGKKLTGVKASFMKKVIDNRSLFMVGGPSLVFKKGKFKFF